MTPERQMAAAARNRAAEGLPAVLRALLDCRDEEIAVFEIRSNALHVNLAAQLTLPPTGFLDSAVLRAHFVTRGGQAVPLHADGKVVGEMIIVRRPPGRTLADEEREAIRETLQQTRGRRADTARRLGISRTTLWRRLRAGVVGSRTA